MLDAGSTKSPTLLQVGSEAGKAGSARTSAKDPTTLSDVYVRVGGAQVGQVDVAVTVNSDNVLLDQPVDLARRPWRRNLPRRNGALDHGSAATAWSSTARRDGYWALRGALPAVQHRLERPARHDRCFIRASWPMTRRPRQIGDTMASMAGRATRSRSSCHQPQRLRRWRLRFQPCRPVDPHGERLRSPRYRGVQLHHIMTVNLSAGTIDHVVNDTGAPATTLNIGVPSYVNDYP